MTELMESVNAAASVDKGWKCPFPHKPLKHNRKNVLPPPKTANNASTLSDNLDAESKHVANIALKFRSGGKEHKMEAQFTAHHLVPGNETWPKTRLNKWVDKRKNWIKGDIGYDVNDAANGLDLPGNTVAAQAGKWGNETFQKDYAFVCMTSDTKDRQFHDRHPSYSDFVINVMNKIATKLEKERKDNGCGKTDCGGAGKKKYDPPYELLERINGVASRMASKLVGSARKWKPPVMTSRFALMYKNRGLTQSQARAQLRKEEFESQYK
jgi:hypothetical protein